VKDLNSDQTYNLVCNDRTEKGKEHKTRERRKWDRSINAANYNPNPLRETKGEGNWKKAPVKNEKKKTLEAGTGRFRLTPYLPC